jgi:hypothetical protein
MTDEIVKEFKFQIQGMDFPVRAKIVRRCPPDGPETFEWTVSHFYKPSAKAGTPYVPSRRTEISLVKAEISMRAYVEQFSSSYDVMPNMNYDDF